ncbi:MAG: Uma2 family endonuclease [Proteobacteria bacterium]|nr:Uma2 family endonuclease [Pseudomonadota bacterium]
MSAAPKLMTAEEFLVWCLDQEGRWELVGGVPTLMMTGARRRHDLVTTNLIIALGNRLRGGPCRPTTADVATRMPNGNLRRADVTVDCAFRPDDELESGEPVVVFEVLSPSTRRTDLLRKTDEYRRHPTLKHFVTLEPDLPYALVWTRGEGGDWTYAEVSGLEEGLVLSALGLELPMAEVYDGLSFES